MNDDDKISLLLYADDIALLAQTEEDLQKNYTLIDWREKWCIKFNSKQEESARERALCQLTECF